ncbi:hypothetical protein F2Q68_00011769 [Brassica cretica]|uniref:HTH myb-type domain-containing protein n=1 Tax=Brassica cretica TaxID=69181 RepID=A0A8S9KS15_BRACR|nr:hypothetical protein F2Q68_00011769 [Brassica cretica]
MGRPPCCDKSNVKKGHWTAEEDAKILTYVAISPRKQVLNRCGKSGRLRWTNSLRPDLKHDSFSPHEEELIIQCHRIIGSSHIIRSVEPHLHVLPHRLLLVSTKGLKHRILRTFCWSDYLLSDPVSPMSSQTQVVGS